jgi:hypothetical protein
MQPIPAKHMKNALRDCRFFRRSSVVLKPGSLQQYVIDQALALHKLPLLMWLWQVTAKRSVEWSRCAGTRRATEGDSSE